MGLDTPTPTGSSSVASSNGSGGGCGSHQSVQHTISGFDPFGSGNPAEMEPKTELGTDGTSTGGVGGTVADDDNFPEDLNGLDGLGPIGPPGTNLLDPKVEPYFTTFHHHHQQPPGPASANGLLQHGHHALQQQHQHQQPMQQPSSFSGPNSAPAGPCSADSGHSSLGGMVGSNSDHLRRPSSSSCRLVIRDPFAPDPAPAQQMQHSPKGQHQQHQNGQQQQLSALSWDGKPPADAKSMSEMARLSAADGAQRPQLVPIPNFKEGGMPPPGLLPHYSFFQTPQQKQRLEQLYPPGTFPPNYWNRWSPMPVPAHMMRPLLPPPGRIVLVPWTPNMPPNLMPPWLAGRLPPGVVPFIVLPGPNGQLRMTPVAHVPPAMFGIPGPPPGAQTPAAGGQQLAQQQAGNGPTSGGSGGKQSGGGGQPAKPKKETAKQRKQREKQEEQQRREQEQQQQQAAAAAAMAMGRSPMDPNGPGGMGGMPPPPPFYGAPGQMPPGPMCGQMPGPMGATQQQQQQQLTPQPDNNACFKVPGRSPPLKRSSSSSVPSGHGSAPLASLTPMPEHRIHALGQCYHCQLEINHQRKAIQCTAISQGCNQLFHWDCAGLSPEAFAEFCRDSRLEWICQNCFHQRSKEQCLMFAY